MATVSSPSAAASPISQMVIRTPSRIRHGRDRSDIIPTGTPLVIGGRISCPWISNSNEEFQIDMEQIGTELHQSISNYFQSTIKRLCDLHKMLTELKKGRGLKLIAFKSDYGYKNIVLENLCEDDPEDSVCLKQYLNGEGNVASILEALKKFGTVLIKDKKTFDFTNKYFTKFSYIINKFDRTDTLTAIPRSRINSILQEIIDDHIFGIKSDFFSAGFLTYNANGSYSKQVNITPEQKCLQEKFIKIINEGDPNEASNRGFNTAKCSQYLISYSNTAVDDCSNYLRQYTNTNKNILEDEYHTFMSYALGVLNKITAQREAFVRDSLSFAYKDPATQENTICYLIDNISTKSDYNGVFPQANLTIFEELVTGAIQVIHGSVNSYSQGLIDGGMDTVHRAYALGYDAGLQANTLNNGSNNGQEESAGFISSWLVDPVTSAASSITSLFSGAAPIESRRTLSDTQARAIVASAVNSRTMRLAVVTDKIEKAKQKRLQESQEAAQLTLNNGERH
ncbi:MAG: hypothetical protein ACON35_03355 [Candidatus Marinamargulisbacteria bacterium]